MAVCNLLIKCKLLLFCCFVSLSIKFTNLLSVVLVILVFLCVLEVIVWSGDECVMS